MTYRTLLSALQDIEDEQLDMPVMAHVDGEFFKCTELIFYESSDQLEDGHPYLEVE